MMIATPIAILFLVIPLALLAATVWLWARVVRGFTAKLAESATCGSCGAGVRGIGTFECPECGADLREVGIVTPQGRRAVSLVAFALGWTLLPLVPALVAFAMLLATGPTHTSSNFRVTITDGPQRLVVSGRFVGAVTGGISTQSSSSTANSRRTATTTLGLPLSPTAVPERLDVRVETPSGMTAMAYDPVAAAFVASGHAGLSGSPQLALPIAPAEVSAVLPPAAAGQPTLNDDQVAGLATLLNGVAAGQPSIAVSGWGGSASSAFGSSSNPPLWYVATLIAVFGLIYIAGYVIYFRLAATTRSTPTVSTPPTV
ncbi:MAG: hypothetical protein AAGB29_08580 [Planctomycetota bacterium]